MRTGWNGEIKAFREAALLVEELETTDSVQIYLNARKVLEGAENDAKAAAKEVFKNGFDTFPKEHSGVRINAWAQISSKFDLREVDEHLLREFHEAGLLDVNAKAWNTARKSGLIESEIDKQIRSEYVKALAAKVELIK